MPVVLQVADHVGAHPPQTDHSNLHVTVPSFSKRFRLAAHILCGGLLRCAALEAAVMPNEGVGRAVVLECCLVSVLEFWRRELRNDALGQNLAEFDAPLIE
jgi:hypothetical protein